MPIIGSRLARPPFPSDWTAGDSHLLSLRVLLIERLTTKRIAQNHARRILTQTTRCINTDRSHCSISLIMSAPFRPVSAFPQYSGTTPAIRPSRRTCFFRVLHFRQIRFQFFEMIFKSSYFENGYKGIFISAGISPNVSLIIFPIFPPSDSDRKRRERKEAGSYCYRLCRKYCRTRHNNPE